jgi:hypothetical protein
MKPFPNKSPNNQPAHDDGFSYIAWGCTAGAGLGLAVGQFIGHWLAWMIMVGSLGMVVGGLIERSRR